MKLLRIGLTLILSGFILIFISLILITIATIDQGLTGAFCVVVFFIPICYGAGPPSLLIALSLIALILSLILITSTILTTYWFLSSRKTPKQKEYILHLFNFRLKTL